MPLILIEGMPGAGKSTVLKAVAKKSNDLVLMHEFQFKRKFISDDFGIYKNGEKIECSNLKIKELEDKLENFILENRFQDNSNAFEEVKIELAKERIKEMEKFDSVVLRESFFGGLVDKCSEKFLKELIKLLIYIHTIFFLTLDDKTLEERQRRRIEERGGKYDDKTSKERNRLFLGQFYGVAERRVKIVYLDAKKSPEEIAEDVIKNLK